MPSKDLLLGELQTVRNNFVLGLAASSLMLTPDAIAQLKSKHAALGNHPFHFEHVAALLAVPEHRDALLQQFVNMQLRVLVTESFGLLKEYSQQTGQSAKWKSQGWHHFARLVRNCLTHNFRFEFSAYDKTLLPVAWNGRVIELAHDGKQMPPELFASPQAWELAQEFLQFAEAKLA